MCLAAGCFAYTNGVTIFDLVQAVLANTIKLRFSAFDGNAIYGGSEELTKQIEDLK